MKIAIVGAHRASKLDAPYDDPEWEIWACSYRNENELPRHDVWFEMHTPAVLKELREYREFLSGLPFIYMQRAFEEYPGSRPYPIEAVVKKFGRHLFRWTPCYMAALAILKAPSQIGFWGFESNAADGYGNQRLCLQHFIWEARHRRGIGVSCPPFLDVEPVLYGYDTLET